MQTTSQSSLVKRARYYQSVIDTEQLVYGNDYAQLKDTYVIFICTFDPFKKGEAVYDVRRVFAHDKNEEVPNGAHELYFNAAAYNKAKDVDLSAFLRYISSKEAKSMLTQTIDTEVEKQKMQKECRLMYAHLNAQWMDARREGIAWQKAQSEAQIERMANDNARLVAEIAALKEAMSQAAAQPQK